MLICRRQEKQKIIRFQLTAVYDAKYFNMDFFSTAGVAFFHSFEEL